MCAQLFREQVIAAPLADVWDFFSTPQNLNKLTPPSVRFRVLGTLPEKMYAGQLIEYRIKPLPGVWLRWRTEIRHVREGAYFVDEQRAGPYRFWYHEHRFTAVPGGVQMTDRVTYEVGWGPFGWLAERLWVRRQVTAIFDYRAKRVAAHFRGATAA
ncbi:MAG: SRPBCC family protein [Candidatus Didemnitutus sp.]|nr:SRPBCC family protein [Candidatus Didemnitutus sp.]